jgi:hypothetical protein
MYVSLVAALVLVATAVAPALSAPLGIHGIANVARDEFRLAAREDAGSNHNVDWSPKKNGPGPEDFIKLLHHSDSNN